MSTTFAILGDGAWGTAVALLLAQKPDHRVAIWSPRVENGLLMQKHRENVRLLPGVRIPDSIQLTLDLTEAILGADLWIAAIPTVYLRATLLPVRDRLAGGPPVVSLAKGLENETFLRPTEILSELLGVQRVAVISGPSHAEEVARGLPASVVAASRDWELAILVQRCFSTDRFRVYTSLDPIGVELGGALKNVIGIAAGICEGLGLGDNARAALLTRGLAEITRFGVALGGDAVTFSGLAGLGDLITTCVSQHRRNRSVGVQLAQGRRWSEIAAGMEMVAEGVFTTRSVHERASRWVSRCRSPARSTACYMRIKTHASPSIT